MEENMFLVDDKARLETERDKFRDTVIELKTYIGTIEEKLEVQKMEFEGDIQFAGECEARAVEDAKNFATAFKFQCKVMDKLRSQTVEVSTLLDSSYHYCTDSSIFSFRREKLIEYLKSLRVKVLALQKEIPEKA